MNQTTVRHILTPYQETKLKDIKTPVLFSGYRSFIKSKVRYRATNNIMLIINNRAYYVRTRNLMATIIERVKINPSLLNK